MPFKSSDALLVMTHVKLGDFLVLTPHLKEVQALYPGVLISVPDFLFPLFSEQNVFRRCISNSQVELHLQNSKRSVLNLSFPLLPNLQTGAGHHRLQGDAFRKYQHAFVSYGEALKDYFPKISLVATQEPYLDIESDLSVLEKWQLRPFNFFTIHSGSDYAPKNWDPKNFEKLAIELLDRYPNFECVSIVGPCDQPLFEKTGVPSRFKEIRDNLRAVAHILNCSLFHVDNDSGVHHLAGVVNVPSITVFGATGPGTWGSMTKRNFIHWGAPNCPNPCEGRRLAECPNRVCLSSIKVEHLVDTAETIVAAYSHI